MAMVYGAGAAAGYTPQQVDAMSMWQFSAALDGYLRANDPNSDKELSESEADDLWDWIRGE